MTNADGTITIKTQIDTSGIEKGLASIEKSINKSTTSMATTINKTFNLLKTAILGVGLGLIIKTITNQLDDAISRVDTLNNFTKVMGNLGIASKDAEQSVDYLSEKLIGLPTTLDDATNAVQRFTSANNNVKASTEMFLALNNAILAGGAPMQLQSSALEQLSQAYAKGKPDMMEWRTAMTTMPAQLKQVAIAMGYVDATALYEALQNGEVTMNDFMVTLTKMNKQGLNGFKSLEEQAKNSTGGIATSITNMKTAVTRGIAQIIDAIGQANIANFFKTIGEAIGMIASWIVTLINLIKLAINAINALFGKKTTTKNVQDTANSFDNLGSSAGVASKGIDEATGSAKKLNKELKNTAAFDEMNILEDKSSSGGTSGAGGLDTTGLGNIGEIDLSGIEQFNEKLQKATKHSKLLAIAISLVGTALAGLEFKKLFGITPKFDKLAGVFLVIYGTIQLIIDLQEMIDNPTWSNFADILTDIAIILSGFALIAGITTTLGLVLIVIGQILATVSQLIKVVDSIIRFIQDPSWENFFDILWNLLGLEGPLGLMLIHILDDVLGVKDNIMEALRPIADWVYNNVIKPIIDIWTALFNKIKEIFTPIIEWFKNVFKQVFDNIKIIIDDLKILFKFAWDKIKEIFTPVADWFKDKFEKAKDKIKEVFSPIVNFFGELWNKIKDKLKGWGEKIGEVVGGAFKNAINVALSAVERILNTPINSINKMISKLQNIPGLGGLTKLNTINIPRLAKGGIINMPGRGVPVGSAIAGERGQEAVLPLTDSQQMALLGEAIGRYITINANITNTMNGRVISRELQKINNESNFAFNG